MYEDGFQDDPFSDMEFDDVFNLITIDRIRKKKITVSLRDKETGDEISLKQSVHQIMDYIQDQTSNSKNLTNKQRLMTNQIMPLCSQAMCSGLPRLLGERHAYMTVTIEKFRYSTIMMMMLSLSLLKWVQQKNLEIVAHEEDVSDEEIEKMDKISRASSTAATGAMMGMSPKEIMQDLLKSGDLDLGEVKKMLNLDNNDDDPN
jgi:hypothetical protein